jgi:phenylalanyl-tRNA synthetase beta chain
MFVSLNWLREFVDLPKDLNPEELGKLLTLRSAEVETVVDQSEALNKVVLGKIIELKKHPGADKLTLAIVDVGKAYKEDGEPVQIVCGGNNLRKGFLGAVALPGSIVKWHGEEVVEMKVAKVRGEKSHGMICTPVEIGLPALEDERELLDLTEICDEIGKSKCKPGTPIAKILNLDDVVIEFDNKTLTHRPDLWGHIGIAREIAAITGSNFSVKEPKVKLPRKDATAAEDLPSIEVENPELCPRYMGMIIRNIKVGESPAWMKARLAATDHSIISNIVDVTNFVMEEVGQPMHAFDLRMIDGGIVVRTAKKGEKITTLDEEEKNLDEGTLLIADHKKPLAVAGVMGGQHSGIQDDTVDILLESANFEPVSVRRASVKLGLRTDSVQRFEKSLDPNQCEHALLRAAELILQICPDAQIGPIVDIANFDDSEPLITVNLNHVREKIGVDISTDEIANYLNSLNFEVQGKVTDGSQNLLIKIPSFRATKDIDIEDDIVEEIARMYGYENIPAIIPELPAKTPEANLERRNKHDAREILAYALDFTETYNYSFYSASTITRFGLDEPAHLKLANILSEDQSHLRTTLIPNLVRALREAVKHEESPRLFEIGHTYKEIGQFMPNEEKCIAGVRVLPHKEKNPFAYIKGDLEQFLKTFGLDAKFEEEKSPASYMHPYQNAALRLRGEVVGHIFTLHPVIAEAEDFDDKVACFELNFSALSEARLANQTYKEESKFPKVQFDISVLLDKKVTTAEIEKAITKSLGKELRVVELFDSYEGDKIEAGKKSLAFRLTLQAEDRTLTSKDLESAQENSWTALEKLGGTIRGK